MKLKLTDKSSEHLHQVATVSWFRKTFPGVSIFAIPNGESRHVATAVKLKAEGVVAGIPDLFVPEWKLFIEMKRAKYGYLSKNQKEVINYLTGVGYGVIVGHGFDDAKSKILDFVEKKLKFQEDFKND